MLIKNVTYSEQPPSFEIRRSDSKAVIVSHCDVEDTEPEGMLCAYWNGAASSSYWNYAAVPLIR